MIRREIFPPKTNYEISKILTVSTGHMRETDSDKLVAAGLSVLQDSYSYMLYTGMGRQTAYEELDLSEEVRNLMDVAANLDCSYIKFDRDGPELENYPLFEW